MTIHKLNDRYDWIVIGDDPGALLSGCLAARLGLSVLAVPFQSSMPVHFGQSRKAECLDPETNLLLGCAPAYDLQGEPTGGIQLLTRIHRKLGLDFGERLVASTGSGDAGPQILSPGLRIRSGLPAVELAAEFSREIGEAKLGRLGLVSQLEQALQGIQAEWDSLPERLTLEPRGPEGQRSRPGGAPVQRSQIASEAGAASLNDFFSGLAFSVSFLDQEDGGWRQWLRQFALSRSGARFRGGMAAYRAELSELARRLGVHETGGVECSRVFVENGRFSGVQLAHGDKMVGVSGGVIGCRLDQVAAIASISGKSPFRSLKAGLKPQSWKFSLALAVRAGGISSAMGSRSLWKEAGAPTLEIEIAQPAEYGLEFEMRGLELVFLRTCLPYESHTLDLAYQCLISARMMRQAAELMPFFDDHVASVCPDFRLPGAASPFSFSSLSQIPDNLLVFAAEPSEGDSTSGVGARAGVDGLFVANREAFPELGSFGPTLAALEATAWIAHRSGFASPFADP